MERQPPLPPEMPAARLALKPKTLVLRTGPLAGEPPVALVHIPLWCGSQHCFLCSILQCAVMQQLLLLLRAGGSGSGSGSGSSKGSSNSTSIGSSRGSSSSEGNIPPFLRAVLRVIRLPRGRGSKRDRSSGGCCSDCSSGGSAACGNPSCSYSGGAAGCGNPSSSCSGGGGDAACWRFFFGRVPIQNTALFATYPVHIMPAILNSTMAPHSSIPYGRESARPPLLLLRLLPPCPRLFPCPRLVWRLNDI
jgi:hypothetical protein